MAPDAAVSPAQPHWTLPTEEGRLCPYCRTELQEHEQVIVCPACRTPHHLECWVDNGRCTTYGCTEVAAPGLWQRLGRSQQATWMPLPRQIRRLPTAEFDVRAYVFALIFWWLFGSLALMLALDLRSYLAAHPEVPAARRRRMTALYWCGIGVGILQITLLLVLMVRFFIFLPHLVAPQPGQ